MRRVGRDGTYGKWSWRDAGAEASTSHLKGLFQFCACIIGALHHLSFKVSNSSVHESSHLWIPLLFRVRFANGVAVSENPLIKRLKHCKSPMNPHRSDKVCGRIHSLTIVKRSSPMLIPLVPRGKPKDLVNVEKTSHLDFLTHSWLSLRRDKTSYSCSMCSSYGLL